MDGKTFKRFKKHIVVPDDILNACWQWIGSKNKGGYGQIATGIRKFGTQKQHSAHRLSYEHFVGEIPKGFSILHSCDVRNCVNPSHLRVGTQAENALDMVSRNRQTSGVKNGMARLSAETAMAIFNATGTQQSIANNFNVSRQTVGDIKSLRRWKHLHS